MVEIQVPRYGVGQMFRDINGFKAEVRALENDPPQFKPGKDDSAYLRIFGRTVHAMELEGIRILRGEEPATDTIQ